MLQSYIVRETPKDKENEREEAWKHFDKIAKTLQNGMEYISPKWDRILICQNRGYQLSIYKAENPNKPLTPNNNVKSEYTLWRDLMSPLDTKKYNLTTRKYKNNDGKLIQTSEEVSRPLNLKEINECLSNFDKRLKEGNIAIQQKNDAKFKKMQELAYEQEGKDKDEAEQLYNNLMNDDISVA